jgi:chromosome segregation ATPase
MEENQNYFTEDNQCKYSTIESQVHSVGNSYKKANFTLNSTKFEENNKGRIMLETYFEKKTYEEKVKILKNRIKKLQEQETEINKKTGKLKEKYVTEQKIKNEKGEGKDIVENYKKMTDKMKEEKKKEIETLRKKRMEEREKAQNEQISKNKVNFHLF